MIWTVIKFFIFTLFMVGWLVIALFHLPTAYRYAMWLDRYDLAIEEEYQGFGCGCFVVAFVYVMIGIAIFTN